MDCNDAALRYAMLTANWLLTLSNFQIVCLYVCDGAKSETCHKTM